LLRFTDRISKRRVVVAFAVAPLIVPLEFCPPVLIAGQERAAFIAFALYSIYGLPIAYLAALLLGVPAWVFSRFYGIRSLPSVIGWFAGLITKILAKGEWILASDPFFVAAALASAVLFRVIVFSSFPPGDVDHAPDNHA
jgi:hypothetical protein